MSYVESYLLRHPLSLIGECCRVAIPPALTPSKFSQLKFLKEMMRVFTSTQVQRHQLTSASFLSISGMAFSMAVFWIKAQASSVFSALIC